MKPEQISNIFVVEDSNTFRAALVNMLQKISDNYLVHGFPSAAECLRKMYLNPEVIVLDYHFESEYDDTLNGYYILKKIKQLSPSTAVIMLSCQKSTKVIKELLAEGAKEFINKQGNGQRKVRELVKKLLKKK